MKWKVNYNASFAYLRASSYRDIVIRLQNQINFGKVPPCGRICCSGLAPCILLLERKFISLYLLLEMFPVKGSHVVDC